MKKQLLISALLLDDEDEQKMVKWQNKLLNFAQEHYPESLEKWDYLINSGEITQLNEMEQDDWEVLCEKYEEAYPEIDYKLGIVVVEAFKEFYEYKKGSS
ncbi:MAG: hypothetical protein H8E55_06615 [Pelagibacterales bacterium]|nr:hypothetical protein [Pelagibacterales bacterium]